MRLNATDLAGRDPHKTATIARRDAEGLVLTIKHGDPLVTQEWRTLATSVLQVDRLGRVLKVLKDRNGPVG